MEISKFKLTTVWRLKKYENSERSDTLTHNMLQFKAHEINCNAEIAGPAFKVSYR
jgi:hypothetical protein